MEIYKVVSAIAVNLCGNDSSPGEAPKGDEGHLQNEVRYNAKVHKKSDFLRPVYKKVKTVTIFVGKKRSAGFPSLIER